MGAWRRRQWMVTECEWFLAWTTTGAAEMADRFGIELDSLRVTLMGETRCNRPDLWRRLRDRDIRANRVPGVDHYEWAAACSRLRGAA